MGLILIGAARSPAASLEQSARDFKTQLAEKILPYWFDTAQDTANGGYLLSDDRVQGRTTPKEKAIVTQARTVWTFSLAHRKGFSDARRDYLKAAAQGYRFLLDHFLDKEQGGYFWKTDLAGKPVNERKMVYGQSFVIYALVEYHRASGDPEALRRAMELYRTLQKRAHDTKHGGWTEHFTRDWTPLPLRDPAGEVEVAGLKSANTHLHLMEALTDLYEVTRDADVRKSLEESLDINTKYFYPLDAAKSCFHRNPDWSAVTDPSSAGLSYGHDVEFAWLMVRAEQALAPEPPDQNDGVLRSAELIQRRGQGQGALRRGRRLGAEPGRDLRRGQVGGGDLFLRQPAGQFVDG